MHKRDFNPTVIKKLFLIKVSADIGGYLKTFEMGDFLTDAI